MSNRISVTGRMGSDMEVQTFDGKDSFFAKGSLAVTTSYDPEQTTWFNLRRWENKLREDGRETIAEKMVEKLKKGHLVAVTGVLKSWATQEEPKNLKYQIDVDEVYFLEQPPKKQQEPPIR